MATNWGELIGAGLEAGVQVYNAQIAKRDYKRQMKLARAQQAAMVYPGTQGFPTLGMGYAASPMAAGVGGAIVSAVTGGLAGYGAGTMFNEALGLGDAAMPTPVSAGCFRTYTPNAARVSPCKEIQAQGPDGRTYTWVYRGRPVLYSGDLATCRRVAKVLRRSVRKAGRGFH